MTLNSVNTKVFSSFAGNRQKQQNQQTPMFAGKNSVALKMMINDVKGIKNTFKAELAENVMEMMPTGVLSAKSQLSSCANEVVDGLSVVNVNASGKFNTLRLALSAVGVICSSQIKNANRLNQDRIIDPLHLERVLEFVNTGLKQHPDTPLKGNVVKIVEKFTPKEEVMNAIMGNAEKIVKGYEHFMDKIISPKLIASESAEKVVEKLALTEDNLLKFGKFTARVDRAAARSVMTAKEPLTPEGQYITTQMYESLISGGPGLKARTFNSWHIFAPENKAVTTFKKGKSLPPMPESFKTVMAEKGLTAEEGLQAVWQRYTAEHATRVLKKVKELKAISDSSFSLVTAKMRKESIPQELIQL